MTGYARRGIVAAANRWITDHYPCAGCGATLGNPCTSDSGTRTAMHVLRRYAALRDAAGGPCPAGCGDQIRIDGRGYRGHAGTGDFHCRRGGA